MKRVKYIVFDKCEMLLFPMSIIHKEVASINRRSRGASPWKVVTSAGFVTIDNGTGYCHGMSESLNITCDPVADNKLLELQYGLSTPS